MSDNILMNRSQFIRALNDLGKLQGVDVRFVTRKGKGSHGRIHYGDRFTTLPDGEIKPFTKEAILKQLGLPKDAI